MDITELSGKTYAKINLHLEILNKRDDGYHNILSLMSNIGVFDLLNIIIAEQNPSADKKVHIVNGGGNNSHILDTIPEQENLIYKAVQLYTKNKPENYIKITVQKNIPGGAGLGGGSSDAARTLLLLNEYYNHYSKDELIRIGAQIGADIPFCIQGGMAVCMGIGDKITPVKTNLNCAVLMINDNIHVDTKKAYQLLKRTETSHKTKKQIADKIFKIEQAIIDKNYKILKKECINDFEQVLFNLHPKIEYFKKKLYALGSDFSIMTGSGSTIVGLFQDKKKADKAKRILETEAQQVFLTSIA